MMEEEGGVDLFRVTERHLSSFLAGPSKSELERLNSERACNKRTLLRFYFLDGSHKTVSAKSARAEDVLISLAGASSSSELRSVGLLLWKGKAGHEDQENNDPWQGGNMTPLNASRETVESLVQRLKEGDSRLVIAVSSLHAFKRLASMMSATPALTQRRATLSRQRAPSADFDFANRLARAADRLVAAEEKSGTQDDDDDADASRDTKLLKHAVDAVAPSLRQKIESLQSSKRALEALLEKMGSRLRAIEAAGGNTAVSSEEYAEPCAPVPAEGDSQNSFANGREIDLCSGWAMKRGKVNRAWKKRYFVLTRDALSYYKSPGETQPKGSIDVVGISAISRSRDAQSPEFTLEIVTFARVFFVRAYTERDLIMWLDSFRELKERSGVSFSLDYAHDDEDRWPSQIYTEGTNPVVSYLQKNTAGWLLKRGKINKRWKRRFCRLYPKENLLSYYKSEDDGAMPAGTIDLSTAADIRKSHDANLAFEVVTEGRLWVFCASTSRELEEWMLTLQLALGLRKSLRALIEPRNTASSDDSAQTSAPRARVTSLDTFESLMLRVKTEFSRFDASLDAFAASSDVVADVDTCREIGEMQTAVISFQGLHCLLLKSSESWTLRFRAALNARLANCIWNQKEAAEEQTDEAYESEEITKNRIRAIPWEARRGYFSYVAKAIIDEGESALELSKACSREAIRGRFGVALERLKQAAMSARTKVAADGNGFLDALCALFSRIDDLFFAFKRSVDDLSTFFPAMYDMGELYASTILAAINDAVSCALFAPIRSRKEASKLSRRFDMPVLMTVLRFAKKYVSKVEDMGFNHFVGTVSQDSDEITFDFLYAMFLQRYLYGTRKIASGFCDQILSRAPASWDEETKGTAVSIDLFNTVEQLSTVSSSILLPIAQREFDMSRQVVLMVTSRMRIKGCAELKEMLCFLSRLHASDCFGLDPSFADLQDSVLLSGRAAASFDGSASTRSATPSLSSAVEAHLQTAAICANNFVLCAQRILDMINTKGGKEESEASQVHNARTLFPIPVGGADQDDLELQSLFESVSGQSLDATLKQEQESYVCAAKFASSVIAQLIFATLTDSLISKIFTPEWLKGRRFLDSIFVTFEDFFDDLRRWIKNPGVLADVFSACVDLFCSAYIHSFIKKCENPRFRPKHVPPSVIFRDKKALMSWVKSRCKMMHAENPFDGETSRTPISIQWFSLIGVLLHESGKALESYFVDENAPKAAVHSILTKGGNRSYSLRLISSILKARSIDAKQGISSHLKGLQPPVAREGWVRFEELHQGRASVKAEETTTRGVLKNCFLKLSSTASTLTAWYGRDESNISAPPENIDQMTQAIHLHCMHIQSVALCSDVVRTSRGGSDRAIGIKIQLCPDEAGHSKYLRFFLPRGHDSFDTLAQWVHQISFASFSSFTHSWVPCRSGGKSKPAKGDSIASFALKRTLRALKR